MGPPPGARAAYVRAPAALRACAAHVALGAMSWLAPGRVDGHMGAALPDPIMRSIISVVTAGVLGIYGLITFARQAMHFRRAPSFH